MPYDLRDATADDIDALVRGRIRMFEDMATHAGTTLDPALADRMKRESTAMFREGWSRDHFGWVAEHEGEVVASAMVSRQPWLPHPRYPSGSRPYFHSVHTHPDHRGHGLATRLTEAAIEWARDQGDTNFVLHASEQGRPVYERLGFTNSSEYILPIA